MQGELIPLPPSQPLPTTIAGAHEYTGARFFLINPAGHQEVIKLLAEGVGIRRIAKIVGCSTHTVIAVRDQYPASVATEKEKLANLARTGTRLAIEGIIDDLATNPDEISAKDKAVITGILAEKSELLSGGATSRIEMIVPQPAADEWDAYIAGLRQASVEVVDAAGQKADQAQVGAGAQAAAGQDQAHQAHADPDDQALDHDASIFNVNEKETSEISQRRITRGMSPRDENTQHIGGQRD